MPTVEARVAAWLDIVAELLGDPLTVFPQEDISRHLLDTFETEVVSFNWRSADGGWGVTALADQPDVRPGLPLDRAVASWLDLPPEMLDYHAALRHQVDVLAESTEPDVDGGALDALTGREQAVLCLLAQGLTAAAIARRLSVSPRTVSKHVEHIYRKLSVRDRLAAVRVAEAAGVRGRRLP